GRPVGPAVGRQYLRPAVLGLARVALRPAGGILDRLPPRLGLGPRALRLDAGGVGLRRGLLGRGGPRPALRPRLYRSPPPAPGLDLHPELRGGVGFPADGAFREPRRLLRLRRLFRRQLPGAGVQALARRPLRPLRLRPALRLLPPPPPRRSALG